MVAVFILVYFHVLETIDAAKGYIVFTEAYTDGVIRYLMPGMIKLLLGPPQV
jgi:hypothetical protein